MKNYIIINKKINPFKKIIKVDADKSLSIRSLIFASQATGVSKIKNLLESEDVINTIICLKKLGVNIKKKNKKYFINGLGIGKFKFKKKLVLNAGNSGTLARLIISLLFKSPYKIKLIGDKSLSKRDFVRIIKPLSKFGFNFYPKNQKTLPLFIKCSKIKNPEKFFENKGSAQVKSAIMLAALNLSNTIIIKAKKSRNHTENFFKFLKIPIQIKKNKILDTIKIRGTNSYKSFNYNVPCDVSSCMFFVALTVLNNNSKITIKNVNINSSRTGAFDILKDMGVKIVFKNQKNYKGEKISDIIVYTPKIIKSINCSKKINSRAIDEFLILFLIASRAKGVSYFKGLEELNHKESPRLKIASDFLNMIGIKNYCDESSIKIFGNPSLILNGNYEMKDFLKDHRVFMMSTIAALTLGGNWKIYDPDSIKTSFPSFLNLIKNFGAEID